MPFSIVRNDISKVGADVLVNAANEQLAAGGGVCGAIFSAAGHARMERACRAIGHCDTGDAVITPAFDLDARYVVHAVGPIWHGGGHGERELLRSAYHAVFARVAELRATSVALPLLSAGIFGYPVAESLELAAASAQEFLEAHPDVSVTLVVYDRRAFAESLSRFHEVNAYIDDAQVAYRPSSRLRELRVAEAARPAPYGGAPAPANVSADTDALTWGEASSSVPTPSRGGIDRADISELLDHLDASFAQTVLALIDERGMTDAETYHRANLSRQLFSKLRRDDHYQPSKQTAVALAFALELGPDEAASLLARAGYALSRTSKFDIIVEYFLARGCHDVLELNEMLFAFDQPLVGSM